MDIHRVLCAGLALALAGCAQRAEHADERISIEPVLELCEKQPDGYERNECYRKQARAVGKRGYCLRLRDVREQAACVASFAKTRNDVPLCLQAGEIWSGSRCLNELAEKTNDVTMCQKHAGFAARDYCVAGFAEHVGKARLCADIKQPNKHDECVKKLAERSGNVADCALTRNAYRRDQCRVILARSKRSSAACATVEDRARRDECYIARATTPGEPTDTCEKVAVRKDLCWRAVAVASDPTLCEKVGADANSHARAACYDAVAQRTAARGADVCGNIANVAAREKCWARMAKTARDPSRCQAITDPETADDCWVGLGADNVDYCVNIKRPELARRCALENWHRATDARVCNVLAPRELQNACRAAASLRKP